MLKTMWPPAPSMHEARTALKIRFNSVTGLPSSRKSVILSIFNRFFKSAHFIALDKLPSASETTRLLVGHILSLHSILTKILPDRSPQFTSPFLEPRSASVLDIAHNPTARLRCSSRNLNLPSTVSPH